MKLSDYHELLDHLFWIGWWWLLWYRIQRAPGIKELDQIVEKTNGK